MVGDNIKAARKARKLTLEQLSEKIGSSSGTLSHIENGSRNPSLEMLNKISEALQVPVAELLNGDTNAENAYFKEVDFYTNPEKSQSLQEEMNSALYGETIANKNLKEAQEMFKVDPDLFITMCRAKDLPEEDRKMLRDMSAKLLEMHRNKKRNSDKEK